MEATLAAQDVDCYAFVPSIYEHGPRLLGRSPKEVCRSTQLLADSALAGWETYHHDIVTVGVDIYNVEAEAFGCRVEDGGGNSVPGIVSHPLADECLPNSLAIPSPGPGNRLQILADAVAQVVAAVGGEVWVYGCMSGPFSQAVELRGFENLIVDMLTDPAQVQALLDKTTELSLQQAARLVRAGGGAYIYESWGTLPLITPEIFADYVVPANKRVIDSLRGAGTPPPAVIMGGDTAKLMDFFIEAGTSLVVADYNTDFDFMREKTTGRQMVVRGCADPKMIERGDWEGLGKSVGRLAEKAAGMRNFVWGCGAVSYDTSSGNLLRFKELCGEHSKAAGTRS